MPTERVFRSAAALLLILAAPVAARAGAVEPKALGNFSDWNAYSYQEDGKLTCYMTTSASKKEPSSVQRKDVAVLVTHRPADKTYDVVSFLTGSPLKKDVDPKVVFDEDKKITLFAEGSTAWARDAKTDQAIVDAMRKGAKMVLFAEMDKNGKLTDTYSLKGVAAAHDAIDKACGVKH